MQALEKLISWFDKKDKTKYVVILTNVKNELSFRNPLPATNKNSYSENTYRCPNCNRVLADIDKTGLKAEPWGYVNFCPHCGQSIDWTEVKK